MSSILLGRFPILHLEFTQQKFRKALMMLSGFTILWLILASLNPLRIARGELTSTGRLISSKTFHSDSLVMYLSRKKPSWTGSQLRILRGAFFGSLLSSTLSATTNGKTGAFVHPRKR